MAEVFHRYIGKDGKLPKVSPQERKEAARRNKLAAELTDERVQAVRANRLRSEMLLAKARNELITKQLVERQAAYLLVALRQRIMSMPSTYARRMVNLPDTKAAAAVLKEIAISVLNEIRDLPQKVVDPNWLRELEKEE